MLVQGFLIATFLGLANPQPKIEAADDHLKLDLKVFELLNEFFYWIYDVYVYDLFEVDRGQEDITIDFLRGSFQYCEILVAYVKVNIEGLLPRDDFSYKFPPESKIDASLARIRLDHNYGIGIIFTTRNVKSVIEFLDSGGMADKGMVEANIVVIVTGPCDEQNISQAEFFVKFGWFSHFVSHLIVIFNSCSKFTFFDVVMNKQAWYELHNSPPFIDLIAFETFDYMGYPIRLSMFMRFPSLVSLHELKDVVMPQYIYKVAPKIEGHTGIEALVWGNLIKQLNFTPIFYQVPRSSYGDVNRETRRFTGTLGDVVYNQTDVAINSRYIKDYGAEKETEFLNYITFDKICLFTPKALVIPTWRAPLMSFEPSAWLGLAIMGLCSTAFWLALMKFRTRGANAQSLGQIFIDVNLLMISMPLPVVQHLKPMEKVMAIPFLFASFYISGVFQAMLTTFISTTNYEKDIKTFKELDQSNLPIVSSSVTYYDLFGEKPIGVIKSLSEKLHIEDRPLPSFAYSALYRNCCSIEREVDGRFSIFRSYTDEFGNPLLNMMSDCPRTYYLGNIIRKGWPFRNDFDRLIRSFKEYGFVRKWNREIQNSLRGKQLIDLAKANIGEEKSAKPFTMSHLTASFYLLGMGLAFASVVFLWEMFTVAQRKLRKSRPRRLPYLP